MNTLTYGVTTVEIPPCCVWNDELNWVPYQRNVEQLLTGGVVVEDWLISAGRPINIANAVSTRAELLIIKGLLENGNNLTLIWMGNSYTVRGKLVDVKTLENSIADPNSNSLYTFSIDFITI